jgi:hypothetical protein
MAGLALVLPVMAQGAMTWRASDEIVLEETHGGGGHDHRGAAPSWFLRDGAGAEAVLWTPALDTRPVTLAGNKATASTRGVDGYHLLVARRTVGAEEQVSLRYFYSPGKPSGHSPRELLQAQVSQLEILPTPLPREHWRYESGEPAAFVVRFAGAPVAYAPVQMITSNGTLLEETTDEQGRVRFNLPEDFADVRPGRMGNAPADFVVSVAHDAGGKRFTTTLNADYHVNPAHWQSLLGGGLTLILGFAAGLVLVRPGKEQQA